MSLRTIILGALALCIAIAANTIGAVYMVSADVNVYLVGWTLLFGNLTAIALGGVATWIWMIRV